MTSKEHKAEYYRRWRKKHTDHLKEYHRKYQVEYREKIAETKRRYRAEHPEKIAEAQRRYRADNPDKVTEYQRRYIGTIIGSLRRRFNDMKRRCENPNTIGYKYYGGRGIKVKFKDANEFVSYVVNVLKVDPRGLQIDRIDNDGHYEPGNIRFATAKTNANNRRARHDKK